MIPILNSLPPPPPPPGHDRFATTGADRGISATTTATGGIAGRTADSASTTLTRPLWQTRWPSATEGGSSCERQTDRQTGGQNEKSTQRTCLTPLFLPFPSSPTCCLVFILHIYTSSLNTAGLPLLQPQIWSRSLLRRRLVSEAKRRSDTERERDRAPKTCFQHMWGCVYLGFWVTFHRS